MFVQPPSVSGADDKARVMSAPELRAYQREAIDAVIAARERDAIMYFVLIDRSPRQGQQRAGFTNLQVVG